MTGRLLTAREVADQLALSVETVLRWTRAGEIPAFRLPGGALRYREDAIEEWLAERATTGRGSATHPAGRRPVGTLSVATHPIREED